MADRKTTTTRFHIRRLEERVMPSHLCGCFGGMRFVQHGTQTSSQSAWQSQFSFQSSSQSVVVHSSVAAAASVSVSAAAAAGGASFSISVS